VSGVSARIVTRMLLECYEETVSVEFKLKYTADIIDRVLQKYM